MSVWAMPKQAVARQGAVSRPVSLFLGHVEHAQGRSNAASISFSRYIQALIEYDQRHDIIGEALVIGLSEPANGKGRGGR